MKYTVFFIMISLVVLFTACSGGDTEPEVSVKSESTAISSETTVFTETDSTTELITSTTLKQTTKLTETTSETTTSVKSAETTSRNTTTAKISVDSMPVKTSAVTNAVAMTFIGSNPDWFANVKGTQNEKQAALAAARELIQEKGWVKTADNEFELAQKVAAYIAGSIGYGSNGSYYTAYGGLVNKEGTCYAYAQSYYFVAMELGLDVKIVSVKKGTMQSAMYKEYDYASGVYLNTSIGFMSDHMGIEYNYKGTKLYIETQTCAIYLKDDVNYEIHLIITAPDKPELVDWLFNQDDIDEILAETQKYAESAGFAYGREYNQQVYALPKVNGVGTGIFGGVYVIKKNDVIDGMKKTIDLLSNNADKNADRVYVSVKDKGNGVYEFCLTCREIKDFSTPQKLEDSLYGKRSYPPYKVEVYAQAELPEYHEETVRDVDVYTSEWYNIPVSDLQGHWVTEHYISEKSGEEYINYMYYTYDGAAYIRQHSGTYTRTG